MTTVTACSFVPSAVYLEYGRYESYWIPQTFWLALLHCNLHAPVLFIQSQSFYTKKVYIAHIDVAIGYFTYPSLAARDQEGLPVSDFESWLWCKERYRPVVRGVNYSNAESETWKRSDLSSVLYRNVKPIVRFIQVLSRLFFCNSKQSKKIFNLVIIIVSMSLLINSVRHIGRYIRWIIIQ